MRGAQTTIKVTVKTKALIETLKENKESHVKLFAETHQAWRDALERKIQDVNREAQAGASDEDITKGLQKISMIQRDKPECRADDYDSVIAMLELHTDNTIELDQTDVERFVRDKWDWKDQLEFLNSSYTQRM
jgi:hypothetical protein